MNIFKHLAKHKTIKKKVEKISLGPDLNPCQEPKYSPEEQRFIAILRESSKPLTTYQLRNKGFTNPMKIANKLRAKGVNIQTETYQSEQKITIIGG